MGGRRSYSMKDVFGVQPKAIGKRVSLTNSFKKGDLSGIAAGAASLMPDHRDLAKIIKYSQSLLDKIKNKYPASELKRLDQIHKKVRLDWAEKKRREQLSSNRIIDLAVIDSVGRVLREKKK